MEEILLSAVYKQECLLEDVVNCAHSFFVSILSMMTIFVKHDWKISFFSCQQWPQIMDKNLLNMTIADIIRLIQSLSAAECHFLSVVATLTKLVVLTPATNVICECSFSILKRLKIYLRSTMWGGRLFHFMVLHVHKQLTVSLGLYSSCQPIRSQQKQ